MAANQAPAPVARGAPPPRAGMPFSEDEVMNLIACVEHYGKSWKAIKADPRFRRGSSNRENAFNLKDKWKALMKRAKEGRPAGFLTPAVLARILQADDEAQKNRSY